MCNNSGCGECQPTNPSNRTMVIPVAGESSYQGYKVYHPDTTISEKEYYDGEFLKINFYNTDEL